MSKKENSLSLLFGVPGFVLQIYGYFLMREGFDVLPLLLAIAGSILLLVGLAYYALAKGHNPALALLAVIPFIGLFVLALLPDEPKRRVKKQKSEARLRTLRGAGRGTSVHQRQSSYSRNRRR